MAETVQYHLEQMVGELEDLERKKLFTKQELKAVVKKRTNFEYALKRRKASRADFLRYISYEINVDALRRKRKQRLGIRGKTTLSDFSIEQRILSIFERALVRHSADLALWLQYIEFVKDRVKQADGEGNTRLLSKLYARAIQKHPFEPRLWIMAAAFELEVNANGSAARLLLQRALRVNPKEKRLWIEYFRLELLLVEKIKARRRVLGIDSATGVSDGNEMQEEEDVSVIHLPTLDEEEQADAEGPMSVREKFEEKAMAKYAKPTDAEQLSANQRSAMAAEANPFLQGAVAKVVFEQAIQAIPHDLDFREQFAAIFMQFPDMETGRQRVLESIASDFSLNVDARAYLCVAHLAAANVTSPGFVDALKLAVSKFKEALRDVDTKEMWAKYVDFLVQWRDASSSEEAMQSLRAYFAALVKRAFVAILENKALRLGPELALRYADLLEEEKREGGNGDVPLDLLNWLADATQKFPQSEDLWHRRLSALVELHSKNAAIGGVASTLRVERLFENEAVAHALGSRKLWDMWFDWIERRCRSGEMAADRVQAKYLAAFVRTAQLPAAHEPLKSWLQVRFVDWAWRLPAHVQLRAAADISASQLECGDEESDEDIMPASLEGEVKQPANIEAARRAYQNVSRHAFPTLGFYERCLEIESDVKHTITLHEFACRLDETNQDPWLKYLKFLVKCKKLDAAASVFWRASKGLRSDAERTVFDTAYQTLLQQK